MSKSGSPAPRRRPTPRAWLAAVAFSAAALFSATAAAEGPPPISTGPEPDEAPKEATETAARFRWGISALAGPAIVGGAVSGGAGVDARFGVQLTRLVGVYGQPVAIGGIGVTSASARDPRNGLQALAFGALGALVDLSVTDFLYVAAGPELAFGSYGAATVDASNAPVVGGAVSTSGTYFSLTSRAGVALGSMRSARRKAFTLGLDLRCIFTPVSAVVLPGLALGYESF